KHCILYLSRGFAYNRHLLPPASVACILEKINFFDLDLCAIVFLAGNLFMSYCESLTEDSVVICYSEVGCETLSFYYIHKEEHSQSNHQSFHCYIVFE